MARMRNPWQGAVYFPESGRPHLLGAAHFYAEALEQTVAPFSFSESSCPWWYMGRPGDAHSIHFGHNGFREWPHGFTEGLQWVVHSILRDGFAAIEWGVAEREAGAATLLFHILPAWSCKVSAGNLLQASPGGTDWHRIDRARCIGLPMPLLRVMQDELQATGALDQHQHHALRKAGDVILGASQINIMGVVHEVDVRLWKATKLSGYAPRASLLKLSPSYRALRALQFAHFAMRIRHALLGEMNALFAEAFSNVGRTFYVGYDDSWAEDDLPSLTELALGSEKDREELRRILDPESAGRREKIQAQIQSARGSHNLA